MNARGVVIVAVLLVLAVALWGAIYYGVPSGNGAGTSPSSSPFNEFTAQFQIAEDAWDGYSGTVYSKLIWGSGAPQWVLEGQVDYTQNGRHFRHLYSKGLIVYGEVDTTTGDYNVSTCDQFDQSRVVNFAYSSFVPEPIEDAKAGLLSGLCPACNAWRLVIADNTFMMLEQDGNVHYSAEFGWYNSS